MTALPYHTLPACPDQITAPTIIARFLDGLGFRYRWATEGLTERDLQFRPVEGSMDMMEVLDHIYRIAASADHFFDGEKTTDKAEAFPDVRKHTLRHIADLSERLKTMESVELVYWQETIMMRPAPGDNIFPFCNKRDNLFLFGS